MRFQNFTRKTHAYSGSESTKVSPPGDVPAIRACQKMSLDSIDLQDQPDTGIKEAGHFGHEEDDSQKEKREHPASRLKRQITA
ncbi:MAG: hypothetical protein ABSG53_10765 [Thermoguttaceae bacterium]